MLDEVEKLMRFVMSGGKTDSDLCKFLALETFSRYKTCAVFTAEITDDAYIAPIGTFGIPKQVLAGWGNISLSVHVPYTDAVKNDKVILVKQAESLQKYPRLSDYEGISQKWESLLVCPILPHGLIALTLDSTPKVDRQLELFLRTIGVIAMHYFKNSYGEGGKTKNGNQGMQIKKLGALSERQKTILSLVERGLSNPAIAAEVGYSESLVRQETMQIYSILKVAGRKELIQRIKD